MSNTNPDYSELVLDNMHFKLTGPIQVSPVDRLAAKITIGDYSLDSNDLLSAWVIGDLTGGSGVTDLKEGVDDNRYRFSTLYTRYPNQISKPYSISKGTLGTGAVKFMGDMIYSGTTYRMASVGTNLYQDTTDRGTMTTAVTPEQLGVSFGGTAAQDIFYVPRTSGYSAFDPSGPTLRNVATSCMAFCLWDDKLIRIDSAGQLYYAITGTAAADTTWTSYGAAGKLDASLAPGTGGGIVRLEVFYNRSGEPAIHVITNRNVWVFDPATPRLYLIPDFGSVHPDFGKASAVWRGELFVAAGFDILAYNGSVVRNLGLSRDQGLPFTYTGSGNGHVIGLVAGQNSLYASAVGSTSGGNTSFSVHEWSGVGWHCLYAKTDISADVISSLALSNATTGGYRLYWGSRGSGTFYYQQLPTAFTNPREALDAGSDIVFGNFTTTAAGFYNTLYYLETGKFNANMKGYRKIANAVEANIHSMSATTETFTLKYRIDNATAWTTLGTTTASGRTVFQFGTLANSIYPGITWEDIEFRVEVQDELPVPYTQVTSFILESLVFSFLPIKNPSLSWTAQIDLTATHNNQSPANMLAKLSTLRTQGTFFSMVHGATTYRCRLAGMSGPQELGQDTRGMVTVSILEIPTQLGIAT